MAILSCTANEITVKMQVVQAAYKALALSAAPQVNNGKLDAKGQLFTDIVGLGPIIEKELGGELVINPCDYVAISDKLLARISELGGQLATATGVANPVSQYAAMYPAAASSWFATALKWALVLGIGYVSYRLLVEHGTIPRLKLPRYAGGRRAA